MSSLMEVKSKRLKLVQSSKALFAVFVVDLNGGTNAPQSYLDFCLADVTQVECLLLTGILIPAGILTYLYHLLRKAPSP